MVSGYKAYDSVSSASINVGKTIKALFATFSVFSSSHSISYNIIGTSGNSKMSIMTVDSTWSPTSIYIYMKSPTEGYSPVSFSGSIITFDGRTDSSELNEIFYLAMCSA